jgi:hypothetical protein
VAATAGGENPGTGKARAASSIMAEIFMLLLQPAETFMLLLLEQRLREVCGSSWNSLDLL